ncbi:MAG TPA: TIGR03435 family protein [Bryobacteraceae bacterium]|nr:TIGR03435 family protein [Bryobacteraceae bacterium]
MEKTTPFAVLLVAFVALQGSRLYAQDITGTWQGIVHSTKDCREVIQISKDGSALKAVLFGLDGQPGLTFDTRPGSTFASTAVNFHRNAVRVEFPGIGSMYQGTLSADGNAVAGTLSQNGTPFTLNLIRATAQTAWPVPEAPAPEMRMTADAGESFEVATIKPTPAGTQGGGSGPSPGGRFTVHNMPLSGLIGGAYGVNRKRMESVPGWLDTDRFDILAKADIEGTLTGAQVKPMIRKLLADRLNLRFHFEKKEATIYVLTVQGSGPKLTPSTSDPNVAGPGGMTRKPGHWHVTALNTNMAAFAGGLQGNVLDQPVIDRTGLTGRFDITLDWAPDELHPAGDPPSGNGAAFPDLFTALRNQLGLKLESTKGLVDVLVIDHVEKPSGN